VFAERIKILRQQKDLSQQELAKIVGKTQQAVGLWEKEGGNEPDHETLNKLADYFNVSTDYLLGRTEISTTDIYTHIQDEHLDQASLLLQNIYKVSVTFSPQGVKMGSISKQKPL
jgi:transcriptional regulator with XRE-family HTH domain